ncbi:hypothetical protein JD969_14510 [Planctomycetota bacterium]|nr:hypothetical protein JD969_14510 [Planctomycetota bacterium]
MSSIIGRTTMGLSANTLNYNLNKTQVEMFKLQQQIDTGKKYANPSDGASSASAILQLNMQLQARDQWDLNLLESQAVLSNVDNALASVTTTLNESVSIASSQIGAGATADTRKDQALIIDAQIDSLLNIANQQYNGVSLFGGNNGASDGGLVFEEFMGGIRYTGGSGNLETNYGGVANQEFTSNGLDAFGALEAAVESTVDLKIQATDQTKLSDLDGANNLGISSGSIIVNVNGTDVSVDLTSAETMGDVVTRVNAAIDATAPGAGSLSIANEGFELNAAAGNTIKIGESGGGRTASDLGIEMTATSGTTATGATVNPRMTTQTPISAFGSSVDFTSGLKVTQGDITKVIDFSSCQNVEDMINAVDAADMGIRLEINEDGTGFNMITEVSGLRMSVGENGGTTAHDLGISTLGDSTKLETFREGLGVETVEGKSDFRVTLHDGTTFEVDVTGTDTVEDVINRINDAATTAGVAVGTDFTVGYASDGTGLTFADNTVGTEDFKIQNVNESHAAEHLGIAHNAGPSNTFTSEDNAKVVVDSVFTNLMDLSTALYTNDESGIVFAGDKLEQRNQEVILARGAVGVDAQQVELQIERSEDLRLAEKSMLSAIEDTNSTEAITKFQMMQVQLQATLQLGAQSMQTTLMDFLR